MSLPYFSDRDHKMCGKEGSHTGAALADLRHRVPEILPHHDVRLHHEGALSSPDRAQEEPLRNNKISDLSIKTWSGDGDCAC